MSEKKWMMVWSCGESQPCMWMSTMRIVRRRESLISEYPSSNSDAWFISLPKNTYYFITKAIHNYKTHETETNRTPTPKTTPKTFWIRTKINNRRIIEVLYFYHHYGIKLAHSKQSLLSAASAHTIGYSSSPSHRTAASNWLTPVSVAPSKVVDLHLNSRHIAYSVPFDTRYILSRGPTLDLSFPVCGVSWLI